MSVRLVERDELIIKTINKYRFCLSRQIRILAGFNTQSSCDRRLRKLIELQLIERKHYLYGVPRLYFITAKAKRLFNLEYASKNEVRIDKIIHDILVIDTVIYFIQNRKINESLITSERELKHADGFSNSKHRPDFIIIDKSNISCVEIELSVKAFKDLLRNVTDNFKNYDEQIWIIDRSKNKLLENLKQLQKQYDLQIIDVEVVKEFVKTI